MTARAVALSSRLLLLGLLLVAMVSALSGQANLPRFERDDCPWFVEQIAFESRSSITCGALLVAEDRASPTESRTLELFVAWIRAREPAGNAPIVYLEGGPGGAASTAIELLADATLQRDYDFIVIDQRGTGLSLPSLNCHELDDPALEDETLRLRACYKRLLAEGAALHTYNSAENARDIHELLLALDIKRANIYGISYGTRLALTLARDYPQRIRALILDGVYPPQIQGLEQQPANANRAFEQLFNDCAKHPDCNAAYPNLRGAFYAAAANLDQQPAEVDQGDYWQTLTGEDFVNEVFSMLYESAALPFLPALIHAYAQGEYEYDPQAEAEDLAIAEALLAADLQPDDFDAAAMKLLDIADLEALYAYYDTLSDNEWDALIADIDFVLAYAPLADYMEMDDLAQVEAVVLALDDDEYAQLQLEALGVYDDDSEGMYHSVECAEEVHFNDSQEIQRQASGLPVAIRPALIRAALESYADCETWSVPPAPPIENAPLISEIPALLLSGAYDPITPPSWAEAAAHHLPHSWHYAFPAIGHGALFESDCADAIALDFLAQPTRAPDASCIDALAPPDFYIRVSASK